MVNKNKMQKAKIISFSPSSSVDIEVICPYCDACQRAMTLGTNPATFKLSDVSGIKPTRAKCLSCNRYFLVDFGEEEDRGKN